MAGLPEQSSPRAARILTAAGELTLHRGSRGVTIATQHAAVLDIITRPATTGSRS